jgi:hypothetical protein
MKHIRHCQPRSTESSVLDHDCIRLQNPLLFLTTNAQSPNIDYICNLYNDQYGGDNYADDQSSVNYDSNISHTNDIVDSDNVNDNVFQEPFMSVNKPFPQQTNASN